MKHFLGVCEVASFFSIKQFLLYSGADDFSVTLDPQELLLLSVFILNVFDISEQSISHAYQEIAACKTELQQAKRIRRNRQGLFIFIYQLPTVNIVTF